MIFEITYSNVVEVSIALVCGCIGAAFFISKAIEFFKNRPR